MREEELEKRLVNSNQFLKAVADSNAVNQEARTKLKAAIVKNNMAIEIVDRSPQAKSIELIQAQASTPPPPKPSTKINKTPYEDVDTTTHPMSKYIDDPNLWLTDNYPYFNMMDRKRWFEAMTAYGKYIATQS